MERKIAVIGLGYVGLPLALALADSFKSVIGFDKNVKKVELLKEGIDPGEEVSSERLKESSLTITSDSSDLSSCNFFILGVPTPIDSQRRPDLSILKAATKTVGEVMPEGSIVVFESTVYPGVTEEVCVPVLEEASGFTWKKDFHVGYSPERINPGDKKHTLENVVKVVAGDTEESLHIVESVYGSIIKAGIHAAPSIMVAEAAKVIENTQRDLNIALMNELSIIFDKLQISSKDVLEAAGTKWNFLNFVPGLVGGHCIGVDPYYLTSRAEELGYTPQVILAGRRINDTMGIYVSQKLIKLLAKRGSHIKGARVGVLGITFKENVADIRNSRVPELICDLKEYGVEVVIHDPRANADAVEEEYAFSLTPFDEMQNLDALVYAVPHEFYTATDLESFANERLINGGVVIDVKSLINHSALRKDISYWAL